MYISDLKWLPEQYRRGQDYCLHPIAAVMPLRSREDVKELPERTLLITEDISWIHSTNDLDTLLYLMVKRETLGLLVTRSTLLDIPWLRGYMQHSREERILLAELPEGEDQHSVRKLFDSFDDGLRQSKRYQDYREELRRLTASSFDILDVLGLLSHHLDCSVDMSTGPNFIPVTYHNSLGILNLEKLLHEKQSDIFSSRGIFTTVKGNVVIYIIRVDYVLDKPALLMLHTQITNPLDSQTMVLVQETLPFIALALNQRQERRVQNQTSREELYLDVLRNHYPDATFQLREQAVLLGINYQEQRFVYAVDYQGVERVEELSGQLLRYLRGQDIPAFLTFNRCHVVFILEGTLARGAEGQGGFLEQLIAFLDRHQGGDTCCISVSERCWNLGTLFDAFGEVKFTMTIGPQLSPGSRIHNYKDYMAYHLLCGMWGDKLLGKVISETIDVLEEYDQKNASYLIETLEQLVNCDFNINQAADLMQLHRNTVYKRVERINHLLGNFLNNPDKRILLQIAIKSKLIADIYNRTEKRFDWNL